MKRVLVFSMAYLPLNVGGAEPAIHEITKRIDPSEIQFDLITCRYDRRFPRVEQIGNVTVYRIGLGITAPKPEDLRKFPLHLNKFLFQFLAPWKAIWLHFKHHYNGVWALMAHSAGVPGALFKLLHPNVKFILSLQEGDPIEHVERAMRPVWPLFTRAFTSADVIQAISTYLADWARARNAQCPIHVIHNGADLMDFDDALFSSERLVPICARIGKQPGDVFLVNTARLVPQKGWDTTIDALALLPPKVKLLVVGGGVEEGPLRERVAAQGLSKRVVFTGAVSSDEVAFYRRAADIFVMPSRTEGLGNAGLSAMASRLPFIGTTVGGMSEYVFGDDSKSSYGKTAWEVAPDQPAEIAAAVETILADPAEVQRVTQNARRLVEERFHWDAVAAAMQAKVFTPLFTTK
ncbi:glycosyltransferase family 4 protein [Candidatus Kaiserbacteria bacterium]|nr:glycosyltransferase family 4 protein [Candidatus Kaiserbacteria bacterium]MCB9812583.1 glycosyltransferase family 4 protein [Candidatus Nomurabacteria bacterium]